MKQLALLAIRRPTWRERLADHLRDFAIRQRARQDKRDRKNSKGKPVPQQFEQKGLFDLKTEETKEPAAEAAQDAKLPISTWLKKVQVRELLFSFTNMEDWINHAAGMFRAHGHSAQSTICVDQAGMICNRGKQFKEARYPVGVYAIDDAPFEPAGMIEKQKENPNREAD